MSQPANMDLSRLLSEATRALEENKAALISLQQPLHTRARIDEITIDPESGRGRNYLTEKSQYSGIRALPTSLCKLEKVKVHKKEQSGPETLQESSSTFSQTANASGASKGKSAGPQWFDMQGAELTEETKRDLHVLQSRAVLDPKRHYKKGTMKTLPKIFQMGTLIEGSTEGRAARLTRKERQKNIVEELLADRSATSYFKRKYNAIQETNNNITRARSKRGKKWKK